MKAIRWILLIIVMLAQSCVRLNGPEYDVPKYGYIFFEPGLSSKSAVVENFSGKSFGVMGYDYTGDWETVKVQATPELFYDLKVSDTKVGESYTGVFSYENPKEWNQGSTYSFFGYYPHSTEPDARVTPSDASYEGVPSITYTMPARNASSENLIDHTLMQDVMTAHVYDVNNSGSGTVNLTFKHRLTAFDIKARNFNANAEKIRNIKVKLTSLLYDAVTLPLDDELPITKTPRTADKSASFVISGHEPVDGAVTILPTSTDDATPSPVTAEDEVMIVIPQTKAENGGSFGISGSISFERYTGSGYTSIEPVDFSSDKDLDPGKRYTFLVTFSDSAIRIVIIESGDWEDNDVDIEFE